MTRRRLRLYRLLIEAGFQDISIERPYDGRAATDDAVIIFVARA